MLENSLAACAAQTGMRDPFLALNETSLLAGLKNEGSVQQRAYLRLVDRAVPLLKGRLHNTFQDPQEAEDVLSETLLALVVGLPGFRGEAKLTTWLYGVLQHKVCDHIGRLQRRRRLFEENALEMAAIGEEDSVDPPTPWDSPAEKIVDHQRLNTWIQNALELLPKSDSEAWILRERDGLCAEAAAENLGISPEAYRVRLCRARKRLADQIKSRMRLESA
jgi:RNA polymerase sigma-70 factor, ECF subfamily